MISNQNKLYIKKSFPFWDLLNFQEQNLIIESCELIYYKSGENIYNGLNDCIGVLLIKQGELRTYILSEDGREITLFRVARDEICILSASCLVKNITFDIHIDAETDTEILSISAKIFSQLSKDNIYVENFMNKEAVNRFSHVMWTIEQILFKAFDQRLAIFLLDETAKRNTNILKLTHEQIAKYMGSAREVVSRMLKYFANENLVALSRGEVKVLDKAKLRKLV